LGIYVDYAIAVDIGATNLRVGLVTRKGEVLHLIKDSTPKTCDPNAIPLKISKMINEILKRANITLENVLGIGVGSIGPLNIREGVIVNPPNLPNVKNIPVKQVLEDIFKVRVIVVNDCVAAVWGEKNYGAGKDYENLVYITISTGIGAGVIVDGNLLLGKDGNAHEVGHIVIRYDDGIKCGCGAIGHWEAYASGANIPKLVKLLLDRWNISRSETKLYELIERNLLTAEALFNLAKASDDIALRIIDELGKINAAGIASVINVYDPELVTLGGAVILNNPEELTIKPMLKYLDNYVLNRLPRVMITPLGHEVTLLGAAALIFNTPKSLSKYIQ